MNNWSILKRAGPIPDGYEVSLGFGYLPRAWAICIGWGYDGEVPLRPWLQTVTTTLPKSGGAFHSYTILGFFICWGSL